MPFCFLRISRFVRVSLFLFIGHAPCGEEYDRSAEYSAIGAHAALITGLRSAGCAEDSADRRICDLVSYRTENSSHFTFRLYGRLSGRAVRICARITLWTTTAGGSATAAALPVAVLKLYDAHFRTVLRDGLLGFELVLCIPDDITVIV